MDIWVWPCKRHASLSAATGIGQAPEFSPYIKNFVTVTIAVGIEPGTIGFGLERFPPQPPVPQYYLRNNLYIFVNVGNLEPDSVNSSC